MPRFLPYRDRCAIVFFFNDTATTEIYTLSLHDALPICWAAGSGSSWGWRPSRRRRSRRSEEHTSELQSHLNLVCRLLLEKKKRQPHERPRRSMLQKEALTEPTRVDCTYGSQGVTHGTGT